MGSLFSIPEKEGDFIKIELYIESDGICYAPSVEDGIQWSTVRKSTPGQLTFNVVQDSVLNIREGSTVRLTVDGTDIFYGFIFTRKRNKEQIISITAYDQLRYLNNSDTYVYTNKTASDLLQIIASDFQLNIGTVENTGYIIPKKSEPNKSLFDIVQNALDATILNTGKIYCLYDDFGKLCLKSPEAMKVGLLIDVQSAQNYDYSSSIDSDVYNQIKLSFDNEDTGKRDVYMSKDTVNINKWGILQYYDTLKEGENGQARADALLKYYNRVARKLKLTGVFGDTRVRAGCLIGVELDLIDAKVQNWMLCEKVVHTFRHNEHTMDLTLTGGDFIA